MFGSIDTILTAVGIVAVQSAGYVIAHVTTIQKPFLSTKQYASGIFSALLCFSICFSIAGYILSTALLALDLITIITVISAIALPQIYLRRVIQQAKQEKAEATQRIQQKPKKQRLDRRRYFYT